ncbi:uncharacterized protein C8A04DRAFT_32888 [Dichotomopilus funicola]|uniref:Uncharacterized protein n=1 Tax=Dichotomopilus funicola TaxID=1934379 RepID=A0AAN6UVM5_9PEZI|nr:hypothetical protein C8A04DRAFT_32888 [Dichotomopilus funicola]
MDSPYHRELQAAIAVAEKAARISRDVLAAASQAAGAREVPSDAALKVEGEGSFGLVKDDLSPVTVADFAIQALLTRTLHNAFPDDGFVGEESADELRENPKLLARISAIFSSSFSAASNSSPLFHDPTDICDAIDSCATLTPSAAGRFWVFDPIDGTKTFIRGQQYAINIALIEDGRQVLSVVACPLLSATTTAAPVNDDSVDSTGRGALLYGVRGHGAYVRPLFAAPDEAQSRRIPRHADDAVGPEDLRSVTCWAALDSGVDVVHKGVAERLNIAFPGCDLLGWVPRWVVMALGAANTTVWVYKRRDRYAKIWDHAGAMLLFEEVGGLITDVHGKNIDLTVGRKFSVNFGFVAAPSKLHGLVLRAVQDTLKIAGKEELLQ